MGEDAVWTKVLNVDDAVYFRVPIDWVVGNEEDGSIVIFDQRPGSGTLRPWTKEFVYDDDAARDEAAIDVHEGRPTETLNDRTTLSNFVFDAEEDRDTLRLYRWVVTVRIDDSRLRVVTFTHTIEAAGENSDETLLELQSIDFAVRGALYPDAALTS